MFSFIKYTYSNVYNQPSHRPDRNNILLTLTLLKKHCIIITRSVDAPGHLHIVWPIVTTTVLIYPNNLYLTNN